MRLSNVIRSRQAPPLNLRNGTVLQLRIVEIGARDHICQRSYISEIEVDYPDACWQHGKAGNIEI